MWDTSAPIVQRRELRDVQCEARVRAYSVPTAASYRLREEGLAHPVKALPTRLSAQASGRAVVCWTRRRTGCITHLTVRDSVYLASNGF
jgi:hypothetical protein